MFYILSLIGICLLPFFFSNTFFLEDVTTPFFALPSSLLKWGIFVSGILHLFSFFHEIKRNSYQNIPLKIKQYTFLVLLLQSILLEGFLNQHLFLASITSIFLFMTSFFLYEEISKQDEKCTFFLHPTILWNLYFCTITITTYLLNV